MNFATIKKFDVANGPGVRVSLFVSGCNHRCKGCFNAEAWDFDYGEKYTDKTEEEILAALDHDFISGLSLLGGEPFDPKNQPCVASLLKKVKERYPQKDVWCYTGYTFDKDLVKGGAAYTEYTDGMVSRIDVLVDGKFVEELKDIKLRFRGSSNQRIIDVKRSLEEGRIKLWLDGGIGGSYYTDEDLAKGKKV